MSAVVPAARTREWFEKLTLGVLPERMAARHGGREALVFRGRRWTFAQLAGDADRVARGLVGLGVEPGERVALWLLNRPEWIAAMFGVMRAGAVLVPVNTRFRTEDVAYVVGQSGARTLIIAARSGPIDYLGMTRGLAPALAREEPRCPRLGRVIVLDDESQGGTIGWSALLAAGAAVDDAAMSRRVAAVDPDATAFLMYTSGTTGFPKGVRHGHCIVRNAIDRASRMGITPADTIMMYLPLFHLFGFGEGPLMAMVSGARQVLTETFDPAESLALIEQERATIVHGFDTHFKELLEVQARAPRDLSSIRTGILATGMSSSVPIARAARTVFGPLLSGYGMSEFGAGATLSFLDSTEEQCVEASGYPAPGYEVRIVDPQTGRDQPAGVPGEILVRGYMVMQGYHDQPEETARAVDGEGWMHTGDMGLLRPDGHLRFMGRYRDMLKIGGENVDPMEVEAYLMAHPAIDLAAVVGVADARLSEVPVAFVRRQAGASLTEAQVIAHCRGRIASFKIPRRVIFIDEFPMTSSGKIQKVKLRAEAEAEAAAGARRPGEAGTPP
jgi:fatty-acyl-CoA synthase